MVIYMERFTVFNGKTHYFDWAMFNSYGTNYQRVGGKHPTIYRLSTVQISSIHSMFITTSAVNCHAYKCVGQCVSSKNGKAFFLGKSWKTWWNIGNSHFFLVIPPFFPYFCEEMERDPSQVGVTTENPAKIHQELIPSSSFKRKDGQKRRKQNDYIPGINIYIYIWNNSWDRWCFLYGKIPDKWRFIAGKFIYKWWFSMAMLNNQMVSLLKRP